MRIGIDFDDTLVKTSESYDKILKKYHVNFNKKYNEYWTEEEAEFILKNYFVEICKDVKIKDGAKEVLNYLSSRGHKLIVITARNNQYSDDVEDITKRCIKDNNLNISEIYFNQWNKYDIAKELNIDLMIDDNIKVYENMKKENIDCILFGDRIKTWKQVLEYIKDKEEKNG